MEEKTFEVVKVVPRERVSERTVEQIVHMPVEIPQVRVQQRTVEFEHKSQLTLNLTQKGTRPMKCPRNPPPSPRRRLIRTTPRGSEHFDELKPMNSGSTHAESRKSSR